MQSKFFLLFLFPVIHLSAQTYRADSLKRALPGLQARQKVDGLNALAREYNFNCIRADSALKYAALAGQYASVVQYNVGIAVSLLTQGDVEGRLLGNMDTMEGKTRAAIELLRNEKDPFTLSLAYYKLAIAEASQGKYDAALSAASAAKQIAAGANDKRGLGWALEAAGLTYCHNGEYWKCFENMIQAQQIGREINDSLLVCTSLAFIGRSFNQVGDPRKALYYYRQALQFAVPFFLLWPHQEDIAYAHLQLKQYDSVLYYQQAHRQNLDALIIEPIVKAKFNVFFWGNSVEVQLAHKHYKEVLLDILPRLQTVRQNGDVIPLMQSFLVLGKVYQGKGNNSTALAYTRELLQTARRTSNKQYLRDACQLMASIFGHLKKTDSSYYYFRNYIAIKDAMDTTQFAQRTALYLASSEAANRISSLQKDKRINEQQLVLNKKELQKQSQLKNLLFASLVILLLLFMMVIRNIILKRKNDKLQNEQVQLALKRKALELEMQALRAQMNPHFIFNCLSAIDNLIQTSQPDKATTYLARFAHLIRGVLDSSKNNLVSFQKDFETLKLYLEMEQFRCNNKFTYSLDADQALLDGDYKVPPLIIQPFVENAIHHGLLNKQDANRQLRVTARLDDEHIIYSVTDNGVGRKRAAFLKDKNRPEHISYGIAITRERIQLHNRNGLANDILITDLDKEGQAAGTTAVVKIDSMYN